MNMRPHKLKWLGLSAYLVCAALVVTFTTPLLGWRALDVLTPSMKPHIAPGALVLVHRVPAGSIRPGQVVTYEDPHHRGVTITHRVVSTGVTRGVPTVTTKGDANQTADAPVPAGSVVGRVEAVVPGLGRVLNLFHSPAALILLVIIPGLVVIGAEARRLRQILAEPIARPARTIRRLDGVYYRVTGLALVAALVALATGSTLAQLTSTASLATSTFVATSTATPTPTPTPTGTATPAPTASPCADVSIHDTGQGSTNVVHCSSTFSSSSSSSTSISVQNDVSQFTSTGNVTINGNTSTSGGAPGSASNSSSSSFDINVTNP